MFLMRPKRRELGLPRSKKLIVEVLAKGSCLAVPLGRLRLTRLHIWLNLQALLEFDSWSCSFLTARVQGFEMGIARITGSIAFAVVIGLIMAFLFRKDEEDRTVAAMQLPDPPPALAIDGEVKLVGKIASPEEIAKLLE